MLFVNFSGMKPLRLIILILLFPTGLSLVAQNEEEEAPGAEISYDKEALRREQDTLDFTSAFINAVKERSIENYDKALEYLAQCEKIFPANTAMLYQTAENYLSLNQPVEAQNYCERALENEPDNFWILDLSARICEKVHDGDCAIEIRKKLYGRKPEEAGKLLRLYYIYKHPAEGRKLLEETKKNGIYVSNLSFYEKKFSPSPSGTPEPESQNADKPHPANDRYSGLLEQLKQTYERRDYQKLLSLSEEALALYPAQSNVYYYHGLALTGLKKFKEAVRTLEDGLDFLTGTDEEKRSYYQAIVNACTQAGDMQKAGKYKKYLNR